MWWCENITSLPKEIGQLTNLKELSLRYCPNINSLPNEIGNLVSLEKVNLAYNYSFDTLPAEITQLKNLKSLDIVDTKISQKEKNKLRKILPNCEIK